MSLPTVGFTAHQHHLGRTVVAAQRPAAFALPGRVVDASVFGVYIGARIFTIES